MVVTRDQMHIVGAAPPPPPPPEVEETSFEIEITEDETAVGRIQLQMYARRRSDFETIEVDWGDGTPPVVYPDTRQFTMYHDFTTAGTYVVKLGKGLAWFRLAEAYVITPQGRISVHKPSIRPLQWSDWIESCESTYSYWNGDIYGTKGVWGDVPKWGARTTNARACYACSLNVTGDVPPWNDAITDVTICYQYTGVTGIIPKWPSAMAWAMEVFERCTGLTGAWTDDPAELMPESCPEHGDAVKDASDAVRRLFRTDWGGTLESNGG